MAQTPEGKIKDWFVRVIRKEFPDAWIYKAPGGPFGRKGVPDLVMSINGNFVAVEIKTDKNNPTPTQQVEINKIRKSGGVALVLKGKDEEFMKKFVKHYRHRPGALAIKDADKDTQVTIKGKKFRVMTKDHGLFTKVYLQNLDNLEEILTTGQDVRSMVYDCAKRLVETKNEQKKGKKV